MEREREGPRRGIGKREKDNRMLHRHVQYGHSPNSAPFSHALLPQRLNKASSRRSLSLSCHPFSPYARTPDDAPNGISLLFSSTSALTSAPPSQRSPAPAPKRRGNLVELGTERGLRPGLASLPAFPFFSHYITCLDLLFSLIHHQKPPLDCLTLWLWIPSYSCSPVPVQFLT